jgi:hypothetical protein
MARKRPSRGKSTKRAKPTSRGKAKRSKKKAAQGAGADVGVLKDPWTGKSAKMPVPKVLKPWPKPTRPAGRVKNPFPR